eukprot:TRINITY_DN24536_c0_g1_i4.p3 TRINITY_DN24536_c0_g1~~TRINITY_DN24536_c0_g1_i4.p3  ORF type:complete len:116 (+),score=31.75 TRINITY_DN24536_c0_g1_i4:359-706(+)
MVIRGDRGGDSHFELASAMIKSIRGSDPDAALYYLGCMLESGEDPRFISRRLILSASEDVGLADPMALPLAISTQHAVEFIGMRKKKKKKKKKHSGDSPQKTNEQHKQKAVQQTA